MVINVEKRVNQTTRLCLKMLTEALLGDRVCMLVLMLSLLLLPVIIYIAIVSAVAIVIVYWKTDIAYVSIS